MEDERTGASAAFALRLAADLLTALVLTGTFSKAAATALIDSSLAGVLASHPAQEQQLREIAAVLTTQISLVAMDAERKLSR